MKAKKISGKVVAIGINDSNIKLCEVAFKGEVLNVFKTVTIKTPEFSYEDGIVKDFPAIVKALNDAFKENNITTKNVVFSVSSSKILSKEVVVPALKSEKSVLSLVTANSGEYFPVSTEDCVYSYSLLDEFVEEENGKQVKKMRIMAYAVANEIINSRYELAKQLGVKIKRVDYTGNTIVEICKRQVKENVSMTLLINARTSIVSIFSNNRLKMQRNISAGTETLVASVARAYNISNAEAATMLETTSLKTIVQEKPLVADAVDDFFNSVSRVHEFYRQKNPDAPVEEAYIFGRGGEIIDISEFFEAHMDIAVSMIEKLANVERVSTGEKAGAKSATSEGSGSEGAEGADTEVVDKDRELFRYMEVLGSVYGTLDFVSKEMEGDKMARARNRNYLFLVLSSLVIGVALIAVPLLEKLNLEEDKKSREREYEQIPDVTEVYNKYSDIYAKYKDIVTFYGTTETEAEALNDFIIALELMRPANCKIETLSCAAGGDVSLSVKSDSWDTTAKFVMQLKAMNMVKDVSVSQIIQGNGENGVSTFSFSATLKITNDVIDTDVIAPEKN